MAKGAPEPAAKIFGATAAIRAMDFGSAMRDKSACGAALRLNDALAWLLAKQHHRAPGTTNGWRMMREDRADVVRTSIRRSETADVRAWRCTMRGRVVRKTA
jgi:hypothetical protein